MLKDQLEPQPLYFQALNSLKLNEQQTLKLIFMQLASLLEIAIIDEGRLREEEMLLQEKLLNYVHILPEKTLLYLNRYKKELLMLYLLLKEHMEDEPLSPGSLPFVLSEMVSSSRGQIFTRQQNEIYLYLVCSIFMPMLLHLMQTHQPQPTLLGLLRPSSICFSLNFSNLSSIYANEGLFLELLLKKPLQIMNKFPTLEGYDFYKNVNLNEVFNQSFCVITSSIIDKNIVGLIQTFSLSKIVDQGELFSKRPSTNNALLNAIERVDVFKIFSQNSRKIDEQHLTSKSFCLTSSISREMLTKMRPFFQSLPPEISPLTKYDILSFASGQQFTTLFCRFATQDYWEHCPQSEFIQVYYLCNESNVEWLSIPSQQYRQSCKIKFWSPNEMQQICSRKYNSCRGVQRKGDIVIVGQGHDHFWRVRKEYGVAVFVKWSILLKSKDQIIKYINIVQNKEKQQLESRWKLQIPHRRLLLSYLSHQYLHLDEPILKRMIYFIQKAIRSEQNCLSKLCRIYQRQLVLIQSQIPNRLRICGLCAKQIINIFAFWEKNIICLWCLPEFIPTADRSFRFQVGYMCKPSALQKFLQIIQSSTTLQSTTNQPQMNKLYEKTFCQGQYLGCLELQHCFGQPIKFFGDAESHLYNLLPSLQLHIFTKRNYFLTLESAIKCYALRRCQSNEQSAQMERIFKYFAQNCLGRELKMKIREEISKHYHEENYVLKMMRLLAVQETNS